MDSFLALLLVTMFFVGAAQVLSTPLVALLTKNDVVRRHLGVYTVGVILYFIGLALFQVTHPHMIRPTPLFVFYFFVGALGLAWYHIKIVFFPGGLS